MLVRCVDPFRIAKFFHPILAEPNSCMQYSRKRENLQLFVAINNESVKEWSDSLVGFMTPLLLAASLAALLLTNEPLPTWRLSWVNKTFEYLRRFRIEDAEYGVAIHKKNQFGVGQPDFNLMAFWLVFLPGVLLFSTGVHHCLNYAKEGADEDHSRTQLAVEYISYQAGWVGTVVLSFFLIPVTRHSVLLAAMNWSPVHALRIHVWAGYLAFFFIFLHGIMMVGVWFKWAPGPIYEEFIPPKDCWTGTIPEDSYCIWQFYNFTGLIAFIFFAVLWVSSFEWFRRKWYRLFYVLHVVFGTLALLASVWHFEFIGLYLLPSLLYYLASTMPTLVQALASRYRGGVKILEVVELDDAGSCLEVRISTDPTAQNTLSDAHPSKFIKLCVPKLSVVWHPFTVYNHPNDKTTLRLMFRPIGPFTKALRTSLLDPIERPVTMIDGFYRGSDHCRQALMCHDHVSIVAGGVAVTPFLSMIFTILKELQAFAAKGMYQQEQPILRSLTLVWSCREAGLLSFIKNTYLNDMALMANGISNFSFKIKIHFTGGKSLNTSMSTAMRLSTAASDSDSKSSEAVTTEDHCNENTMIAAMVEDAVHQKKIDDRDVSKIHNANAIARRGHHMELARMMPARFSSIKWNLPYFIAFAGSVWLGFHVMFSQYDYGPSYRELSEEVWVTILLVVFFVCVGALIEASVLLFRKKWPAPRFDDFQVIHATQNRMKAIDVSSEAEVNLSSFFESFTGRPSPSDMLADAQLATAPGIFTCGPKEMTQMLRAAAGQENSTFGFLTRYAIYEESFEM
jgi:predicted ferric reductase